MSATRLVRPATAFALSADARKRPRAGNGAHLAFIRELVCVASGSATNIEACHVRYQSLPHGKPETGLAKKPSDCWVVPLTPVLHRKQHGMDERQFWRDLDIDPLVVAALLFTVSGDIDAGKQILRAARSGRFPWSP